MFDPPKRTDYNFCPFGCKSFSLGSLLDYKKGALCNSVCIKADILGSTAHLDALIITSVIKN